LKMWLVVPESRTQSSLEMVRSFAGYATSVSALLTESAAWFVQSRPPPPFPFDFGPCPSFPSFRPTITLDVALLFAVNAFLVSVVCSGLGTSFLIRSPVHRNIVGSSPMFVTSADFLQQDGYKLIRGECQSIRFTSQVC